MRQQAKLNTEVAVVALVAPPEPIDALLDGLRNIQTIAMYDKPSDESMNQIQVLVARALLSAREVKRK